MTKSEDQDMIYLAVSIIDYEGIYHMRAFASKDDADKVVNDIKEYDRIGQYLKNIPEPKFWKELRGDDWEVIPKKLHNGLV